MSQNPFHRAQLAAKRVTDIAGALVGLMVAAPIMLVVAIAIKLTSPGPVFFHQTRIGQHQKPFRIHKFRTMTCHHTPSLEPVRGTHEEITPIGKRLRDTSLDELPQLFNVLCGQMSLVGPRPHADYHSEYYAANIPEYRERFTIRPGITGAVQVSNIRNFSHTLEEVRQHALLDIAYMQGWHYGRDIRILFQTVLVVLGRYQKNRDHFKNAPAPKS